VKPGRELDALVAEKVFGAVVSWDKYAGGNHPHSPSINTPECPSCGYDGHWDHDAVPNYSTDISAAWQVVDRLTEVFADMELTVDKGMWECLFDTREIVPEHFLAGADTAPHAICLAALKAVEAKATAPVLRPKK